jgi:hypothetical protein
MSTPDPKPTHGGARKGAGRVSPLTGPRERASIVITAPDRITLETLGDGVLSLGIQRAAEMLRKATGSPT